jgi:putative membrane protein
MQQACNSETIAFIGGAHSGADGNDHNSKLPKNRRSSKIRLSSKSPAKRDGNKRRSSISTVKSILKSLSPKRDRDGDIFFSPYQDNDNELSPETKNTSDRQKSVVIGSETIIEDGMSASMLLLPTQSSDNHSGKNSKIPSVVFPRNGGRPTLSSLESDTTKDLEAALALPLSPKRNTRPSTTRFVDTEPNRKYNQIREKRKSDHSPDPEALNARLRSKNLLSSAENQNHSIHSSDGAKRRRLSKRARTRLTMREVNSHIQPGRHYSSLESMCHFEKRKTITIPKIIDFFLRVEGKLIAVNVGVSAIITLIVVHTFPARWQDSLKATSLAVSILGAFLSFALVFRTQACYDRWWEARTQWGRMTSACVNIAGQARNWFYDEDLVDKFLSYCIVFPYACKALLRGNQLNDTMEEGPRFLHSGMLTDADMGVIIRHGRPPFVCLEIMRRTVYEAFRHDAQCEIPPEMMNGILLSMEQSLWELNLNFGACLKINNTRMPASYTVFMRSFVLFFFVMASLTWAPTLKWLTPIITGFMVFVINTVIVIGDQMMHPFELQWAGLALQKFCVIIEHEVLNVSRRHADIECLFISSA